MVLQWKERLTLRRLLWWLAISAVAICGVAFRSVGLRRSLWLDEAWVANSVTAGSWADMFWYHPWLQTSPPLFLVLERMTVGAFGLTAFAFRLVPFLFGLIAVACMFILARRLLTLRFAAAAWALVVFSHVAIYYSRSAKQYSLEQAASTAVILMCILYLERPAASRFYALLAVIAAGLPMAYPVAFLLPGVTLLVVLATWLPSSASGSRTMRWIGLARASLLAVVAGGMLVGIYLLFVRPNTSPSLYSHFDHGRGGRSFASYTVFSGHKLLDLLPLPHSLVDAGRFVYGAWTVAFLGGFILACRAFRNGSGKWIQVQILCGLPCILLILCDGLAWFPNTPRTSLFVLPALALLFMCDLQLIVDFSLRHYRRKWLERFLDVAVACVMLFLAVECVKLSRTFMQGEEEDVASAVEYLKANVQPRDILFVHASCSEQFKLYAMMDGWGDAPVQFGRTGWPCCPRGIAVSRGSGRNEDVRSDVYRAVPAVFAGKVWILYSTKANQVIYIGADQDAMMMNALRERGCLQEPTPTFQNIGVSLFDCTGPPGRP